MKRQSQRATPDLQSMSTKNNEWDQVVKGFDPWHRKGFTESRKNCTWGLMGL